MTIFLTSDLYFGHQNIIKLCKRPFASSEEMDTAMIARWNEVVTPEDTIYVLGDVAYRQASGAFPQIFEQLNGNKHLIYGNHDNNEVRNQPWQSVTNYREINVDGKQIFLFHYPIRSWNGMYRGALHLYGHEHGNVPNFSNCCDIGVDCWNFYPVTLQQIGERIAGLPKWVAQTD
jgi:calcineurin-like phosphoesterase family protein